MDVNFAPINLQALIKLRDLAISEPGLACTLLGVNEEFVRIFAHLVPEDFGAVACVKASLFRPRGDVEWWQRLLDALQRGDDEHITALLECISLRDELNEVRS